MVENSSAVSRETIFTVHANDADGYYKLIVTVATAFLGGSLLFLEKFVPSPTWWTLGLLLVGWACLVGAIGRVTQVRRANIAAARHALEGDFETSSEIGARSDKKSTDAARLLVVGMALMVLVGVFTLGGKIMEAKKSTTRTPATTGERTIHYGSTGPQKGPGGSSGSTSGSGSSGGSSGGGTQAGKK